MVAGGSSAEWAVAIATLLLALGTFWLAFQNRSLVKAARAEAEKVGDEAQASREMLEEVRRDRQLNWQPYLVPNSAGNRVFQVSNAGRGPAIRVLLAERMDGSAWLLGELRPTIEPGGVYREFPVRRMPQAPPADLFPDNERRVVLICQDQFGGWLNFDGVSGEPTRFVLGGGAKPLWVSWAELDRS